MILLREQEKSITVQQGQDKVWISNESKDFVKSKERQREKCKLEQHTAQTYVAPDVCDSLTVARLNEKMFLINGI